MKALFWHRRDLRIEDNAGLYSALKSNDSVQPIFIFDSEILSKLNSNDQRVLFIHNEISRLKSEYQNLGSDLLVFYGNPIKIIPDLCQKMDVQSLLTNKDYEPYAISRDKFIYEELQKINVNFIAKKDHVIFEKNEVLKADALPYTVFTPYMKKWRVKLNEFYLKSYPTEKYIQNLSKIDEISKLISLEKMGFENDNFYVFPSDKLNEKIVKNYSETRDIPSILGTRRLNLALRF